MNFCDGSKVAGTPGTIQPLHRPVGGPHHRGSVHAMAHRIKTLPVGRARIRHLRPRWVGRPSGVLDLPCAAILPEIPGADLGVGPLGGTESMNGRLADGMRWTGFVVEGAGSHGMESEGLKELGSGMARRDVSSRSPGGDRGGDGGGGGDPAPGDPPGWAPWITGLPTGLDATPAKRWRPSPNPEAIPRSRRRDRNLAGPSGRSANGSPTTPGGVRPA